GFALGRNIDLACGIVAHEHDSERRLLWQRFHRRRDLGPHARGYRFAVDSPSAHAFSIMRARNASTLASLTPSISIVFKRAVAPRVTFTLLFATPSALASRASSAALALPSSGAARTRAFR